MQCLLVVRARQIRSVLQLPAGAVEFLSDELFVGKDGLILGGEHLVGEIVECVVGRQLPFRRRE